MEKVLLMILQIVVREMSPEIRKIIVDFYTKLKEAASNTKNPFDDLLVVLLGEALGLD